MKLGKERIQRLLTKAVEKYNAEPGVEAVKPISTLFNYNGITHKLREISMALPVLCPERFSPDDGSGKYDITNAQVSAAYLGKVDAIKPHFFEACYIYVYGKPSKGSAHDLDDTRPDISPKQGLNQEAASKRRFSILVWLSAIILLAMLFFALQLSSERQNSAALQRRLDTLNTEIFSRYRPKQAEIDSLEGVWLVTTGSPQARPNDPDRFHKVVPNIMEVKFTGSHFTFVRYGPLITQVGYMRFERPGLISIHSYFKTEKDTVVTPKHSLMNLDTGKRNLTAISASWNFDPENNFIIGIREVYTRLGKGGTVELVRDVPNLSGRVTWRHENNRTDTFTLKNMLLDSLADANIKLLVGPESMLLKDPDPTVILKESRTNVRRGN